MRSRNDFSLCVSVSIGFSGGSDGKESACNADVRDAGSISGLGRSLGKRMAPVFLPGEFHGQRSLLGYSLWGHKELDTTDRLTLSLLGSSLVAQTVKNLPAVQEIWAQSLGWEDPLKKGISHISRKWNHICWMAESDFKRGSQQDGV